AQTSNVKKIKGKKPFFSQNQRMRFVEQTGLADKVVLGAKVRFLSHILTEQPDIIALGYDQTAYTKDLGHRLADAGLAVKICRLKAFKPGKYKSSLLK